MPIDITGPKVLTPTVLFALLALNIFPGPKNGLFTAVFRGVVLSLVYYLIARLLKISLRPADLIVPAVLFVLLYPGILLTIPPGRRGVFMSGQSSLAAVGVHTLVYALVFSFLRGQFPNYY